MLPRLRCGPVRAVYAPREPLPTPVRSVRSLRSRFFYLFLCGLTGLAGCSSPRPPLLDLSERVPPPPAPDALREFRGVWVATVDNIDWPTEPGLSVAEQQAELRTILDRAAFLNLNAVILQVRPAADAFYVSPYEPWSAYLTGAQGRAPEPFYDPLAFAVEEAHRRGLELHAWFNPFRAYHPSAPVALDARHTSRTHPGAVHRYGELLWMDPGEPAIVEHSLRVILDVVGRYDIDGVHLDDYFYPYPVTDSLDRPVPFPDSTSWAHAAAAGNPLGRDDWRRQNVDRFLERLYGGVKAAKPWVKVGISPFGIWRPGYPEGVTGFDAYAGIYADARRWQQAGWLDYLAPQLYWAIASEGQPYADLLAWWSEQNAAGRHLWPGNYASRIGFEGRARWEPTEIVEQVRLTRDFAGATGNVLFSMKVLRDTASVLGQQLAAEVYAAPALVPPSPWLDSDAPAVPTLAVEAAGDRLALALVPGGPEPVWRWVVRVRHGATWTVDVVPGWEQSVLLASGAEPEPDEVAVSAVDRVGNESPVVRLTLE